MTFFIFLWFFFVCYFFHFFLFMRKIFSFILLLILFLSFLKFYVIFSLFVNCLWIVYEFFTTVLKNFQPEIKRRNEDFFLPEIKWAENRILRDTNEAIQFSFIWVVFATASQASIDVKLVGVKWQFVGWVNVMSHGDTFVRLREGGRL